MANFIKTQNSFANGEVAPEFYAHDNINGLCKLENMDVLPGGGLARRMGLQSVYKLPNVARLVSFSGVDSSEYVIALTENHMHVFHGTEHIQDLRTP